MKAIVSGRLLTSPPPPDCRAAGSRYAPTITEVDTPCRAKIRPRPVGEQRVEFDETSRKIRCPGMSRGSVGKIATIPGAEREDPDRPGWRRVEVRPDHRGDYSQTLRERTRRIVVGAVPLVPVASHMHTYRCVRFLLVRHLCCQAGLGVVVGLRSQFDDHLVEQTGERERCRIRTDRHEPVAADVEPFERRAPTE